MTTADWGALIPAIVALITAIVGILKNRQTAKTLNQHIANPPGQAGSVTVNPSP